MKNSTTISAKGYDSALYETSGANPNNTITTNTI
jgi:hypothetical protein